MPSKKGYKFTRAQIQFVLDATGSTADIAAAFTASFGVPITTGSIRHILLNYGPPLPLPAEGHGRFSRDQVLWILAYDGTASCRSTAAAFNARFTVTPPATLNDIQHLKEKYTTRPLPTETAQVIRSTRRQHPAARGNQSLPTSSRQHSSAPADQRPDMGSNQYSPAPIDRYPPLDYETLATQGIFFGAEPVFSMPNYEFRASRSRDEQELSAFHHLAATFFDPEQTPMLDLEQVSGEQLAIGQPSGAVQQFSALLPRLAPKPSERHLSFSPRYSQHPSPFSQEFTEQPHPFDHQNQVGTPDQTFWDPRAYQHQRQPQSFEERQFRDDALAPSEQAWAEDHEPQQYESPVAHHPDEFAASDEYPLHPYTDQAQPQHSNDPLASHDYSPRPHDPEQFPGYPPYQPKTDPAQQQAPEYHPRPYHPPSHQHDARGDWQ